MKVECHHSGFSQKLLINHKPDYLRIFSGSDAAASNSSFNTLTISLDASISSSLKWIEPVKKANDALQQGYKILWDFDYGDFSEEMEILSIELALDHFLKNIWKEFSEHSIGVLLFRGRAQEYSEKQHDIKTLASRLDEEIAVFLLIDSSSLEDAAHYFSIVRQDDFGHFIPIIKGKWAEKFPLALPSLAWNHPRSPYGFFSDKPLQEDRLSCRQSLAILLPNEIRIDMLNQVIRDYENEPFRVIPSSLLTQEWEGIDTLIVFAYDTSMRTKRNLIGFSITGGQILYSRSK